MPSSCFSKVAAAWSPSTTAPIRTAGKEAIQELIGAAATGNVFWNTVSGQNVINVSPEHFVTCNGVTYGGNVAYSDPSRGVAADSYPFFNNTPDERYVSFDFLPEADETETLFGSDFVQNGSEHLLGFTHRRNDWEGIVVAYQPGEHEPTAFDLNGANFQILAKRHPLVGTPRSARRRIAHRHPRAPVRTTSRSIGTPVR